MLLRSSLLKGICDVITFTMGTSRLCVETRETVVVLGIMEREGRVVGQKKIVECLEGDEIRLVVLKEMRDHRG